MTDFGLREFMDKRQAQWRTALASAGIDPLDTSDKLAKFEIESFVLFWEKVRAGEIAGLSLAGGRWAYKGGRAPYALQNFLRSEYTGEYIAFNFATYERLQYNHDEQMILPWNREKESDYLGRLPPLTSWSEKFRIAYVEAIVFNEPDQIEQSISGSFRSAHGFYDAQRQILTANGADAFVESNNDLIGPTIEILNPALINRYYFAKMP